LPNNPDGVSSAERSWQVATIVMNPAGLAEFLAVNTPLILAPYAEAIRARQKALCPRDSHTTRHMADNIEISVGEDYVDVGPSAAFWWARPLEVGGATNRKPHPFVRPSVHL
jgi:hypothetical protein